MHNKSFFDRVVALGLLSTLLTACEKSETSSSSDSTETTTYYTPTEEVTEYDFASNALDEASSEVDYELDGAIGSTDQHGMETRDETDNPRPVAERRPSDKPKKFILHLTFLRDGKPLKKKVQGMADTIVRSGTISVEMDSGWINKREVFANDINDSLVREITFTDFTVNSVTISGSRREVLKKRANGKYSFTISSDGRLTKTVEGQTSTLTQKAKRVIIRTFEEPINTINGIAQGTNSEGKNYTIEINEIKKYRHFPFSIGGTRVTTITHNDTTRILTVNYGDGVTRDNKATVTLKENDKTLKENAEIQLGSKWTSLKHVRRRRKGKE